MPQKERSLDQFEYLGGHPALDFVNTGDYLGDYDDFLYWNLKAGELWPKAVQAFSKTKPRSKAEAYRRTIEFREQLRLVFVAIAQHQKLPQDGLDHLNRFIAETVAWRRIAADRKCGGKEICCVWDFTDAPPIAALGPVAWDAADLLENAPPERIKECPPPDGCGWLFLDMSKNRSRHWCSMKTCGNAAKVRRFRQARR